MWCLSIENVSYKASIFNIKRASVCQSTDVLIAMQNG